MKMKSTLIGATLLSAASIASAAGFTLTSPEIKAGGTIDKKFEFNGFG